MWSNVTEIEFQSGSRVPDTPPSSEIGAFDVDDNHKVYVYWKKLDTLYENGPHSRYSIDVAVDNVPGTQQPPLTSIGINVVYQQSVAKENATLTFGIRSQNAVGLSRDETRIVVPEKARRCSDVKYVKKLVDNVNGSRTYTLSWGPPNDDHICNVTSYTVFWCNATNEAANQCDVSVVFFGLVIFIIFNFFSLALFRVTLILNVSV